jgi:hypothetical protein
LKFNFVEKLAQNRPKADKGRYYILNLIFLKNELKIGRKPIKGDTVPNPLKCKKIQKKVGISRGQRGLCAFQGAMPFSGGKLFFFLISLCFFDFLNNSTQKTKCGLLNF